ncbi:MAG TPA: hypothetical protein PLG87_08800 [Treponemataceae bacterium]|nr:hypothetical protein [Treponemataceae bacterium]
MKRLLSIIVVCLTTVTFFSQNTPSSNTTIKDIQVTLDNDNLNEITLSWILPPSSQIAAIRVYRSNSQILSSNLDNLLPVTSLPGNTTRYKDTVPDAEAEYYYALISELEDKSVFKLVIPSVNATVTAVTPLPLQTKLASLIQPNPSENGRNERSLIPLPYLNILVHSEELKTTISPEAQILAQKLGSGSNYYSSNPIYIFPEDVKPLSGEQYLLSTIINSSFIQNDWIQAEAELRNFLSINRSAEITKRAVFYTAQTLYYQARYPEALRLFIDTEDTFPDLTREWVESVLHLYEIP